MNLRTIPSTKEGIRGIFKDSALSLIVRAVPERSVKLAQETSQELCMSASRVPRSSAGIFCIKRGALIQWTSKAILLTVQTSHENEEEIVAMELNELED